MTDDIPRGIVAHEHVEGLTLIFRERHSAGHRSAFRRAGAAAALVGMGYVAIASLLAVALGASTLASDGVVDALLVLLMVLVYAVVPVIVLAPTLTVIGGIILAVVMYHDAGRTQVHLTVGARGIIVERRSEGETTILPPDADLFVGVDGDAAIPTLSLRNARHHVRLPILGDVATVEWLADRIRQRCAASGTADAIPEALQQARRQKT